MPRAEDARKSPRGPRRVRRGEFRSEQGPIDRLRPGPRFVMCRGQGQGGGDERQAKGKRARGGPGEEEEVLECEPEGEVLPEVLQRNLKSPKVESNYRQPSGM